MATAFTILELNALHFVPEWWRSSQAVACTTFPSPPFVSVALLGQNIACKLGVGSAIDRRRDCANLEMASLSSAGLVSPSGLEPERVPAREAVTLYSLPDDVLRRIIDTVGRGAETGAAPVLGPPVHRPVSALKTAHILAAVSSRLRSYVVKSYLPSVSTIRLHELAPLAEHDDSELAGEALVALLSKTTNLKIFAPEGTKPAMVTSRAIGAMTAAAAGTLEDVDIKFIDATDEAVRPLFGCPKLKRLQVSYDRVLTRSLFNFGADGTITAPLLYLDLTWLDCVDRNAVRHIAQIKTLEVLLLKNCENFDNEAAEILAAGPAAQSLKTLSVCYCPISNEILIKLIRSMPNLSQILVAERSGPNAIEGAYTQAGIDEARSECVNVSIMYDA
jgi:hypothetical protein